MRPTAFRPLFVAAACAAVGLWAACSADSRVDGELPKPDAGTVTETPHDAGTRDLPPFDAGTVDHAPPDAGIDPETDDGAPDAGRPPIPKCDGPAPTATQATFHDVWQANRDTWTEYWIPGAYVTAVSRGGCVAGTACQLFVQSAEGYADLAAGSQQALRIVVSAGAAKYFTDLHPGDKVDLDASAMRDISNGANELRMHVSLNIPGCAKKVGQGTLVPVPVELTDLTIEAYEHTVGPLLVKVAPASGKPGQPNETFVLWKTGHFSNADPTTLTSLSPFYAPGAQFTGLTAGTTHDFTGVTGVFGLFVPPTTSGPAPKFEEIYVRSGDDYPILKVH